MSALDLPSEPEEPGRAERSKFGGADRLKAREVAAMHASDGIAAWRWWTLAEMDSTAEVIWPPGLADLIRSMLD